MMPEPFDPEHISADLRLLDHINTNIKGGSIITESLKLSSNLEERLRYWAQKPWTSDVLSEVAARSAGMDTGLMNCYNTCVSQVKSIFQNAYFTRVWTFQEMIRKYFSSVDCLMSIVYLWGVIARLRDMHVLKTTDQFSFC